MYEKKIIGNSLPISYEKLKYFLEFSQNCMTKIINYAENTTGTGFFIKINLKEFSDIQRPFLMTNNHVINEEYLESNNKLYIKINGKEKILDLKNRIKLTDKSNDFTIIELKTYDKIYNFFEVSPNIMENNSQNNLKDANIILPQFPGEKELSIGFGSILKIEDNIIYHSISTEYGSSGSPILLENNLKIIGIHNKRDLELNENKGIFMKNILFWIKNMKEMKNINMIKDNLDYKISDLDLIKTIKNENEIQTIILLKDERLCSLDKNGNIKIYDNYIFNIQIEINNDNKVENFIGNIACTKDNELLFLSNNVLKIIDLRNSNIYEIIQIINLPHVYEYKKDFYREICINETENIIKIYYNIIGYNKEQVLIEKIGNDYKVKDYNKDLDYFYMNYFKFNEWEFECRSWPGRPPPSLFFTLYKDKNKIEYNTDEIFLGSINNKKQILFIEPSFIVIGNCQTLIDLNNSDKLFIERDVFDEKAFKNENEKEIKNDNDLYENLNNKSLLFLGKYLIQLNIINNNNTFDFKIFEKRKDITGTYFLRNDDILFVLNGKDISVYHF